MSQGKEATCHGPIYERMVRGAAAAGGVPTSKDKFEGEGVSGIASDDSYEDLASTAPVTITAAQNGSSPSAPIGNASDKTQSTGVFFLNFFIS